MKTMSLALAEEEMSLRVQIAAVMDACPILDMHPSYKDVELIGDCRYDLVRNIALLEQMAAKASPEARARFAQRLRADEVARMAEAAGL